ncbi:hypothetical protein ACGFJT_44310 [Actinomadura geliboluensis]|uniref:hypothetical protein n=1 Tax=Actinomadura geliboluensis TaxID=882440 RepID=UPI00371FD726
MWGFYSGGDLYLIGDRVLWYPAQEHHQAPQCVARARGGRRCRNDLDSNAPFAEQPNWLRQQVGEVFDVHHVSGPAGPLTELVHRRYEQQRCSVHVDADAPDAAAVEWEVYDPRRHRRTTPCPLDFACPGCDLVVSVDQALRPRLGPCPACGDEGWELLGQCASGGPWPGWRLVTGIAVTDRPLLSLR